MLVLLDLILALIIFGVPLFFLSNKKFPSFPRTLTGKFVLTVLIVWFLSILHREFSLPFRIRAAHESGDLLYDGGVTSLFIFLGGWLLGIIGSIPALIIRPIVSLFVSSRSTSHDFTPPSSIDSSNPYSPPTSPQKNFADH